MSTTHANPCSERKNESGSFTAVKYHILQCMEKDDASYEKMLMLLLLAFYVVATTAFFGSCRVGGVGGI